MNLRQLPTKATVYTSVFLTALIILLASGGLSYQQIRSLRKTESEVRHSQDIQLGLERLFLTLKDAETGQRGFLITNDSSYLADYILANDRVGLTVDSLRKMFVSESSQREILNDLESVIKSRLETLHTTLSFAHIMSPIPEEMRRSMKKGQNEMNLIRVRIDRMVGNEKSLFNERKSKYQTDIEIQPLIYLFIILFALGIFTFAFFKITTDRLHLQNANEQLEKAVSEISMQNTRLKLSHVQLAETEFRHDQMINEVEDYAIILLNREGIIEKWNKGAQKIKGYSDEEIIGKSFEIFYAPSDQQSKLPQLLLDQARLRGRTSHEGWRIRKDGSKFWGNVIITALHDDNQNVIGFTKVTRDLTQQKQAEENQAIYRRSIERKNAELEVINNELASFNHIASHDLQEPLRKIQTFISRIVEEQLDPSTERGQEYFNRIRNSANRMQLLIDDLITYSHTRGDKNVVPADLNQILSTVLTEMNQRMEDSKAEVIAQPMPTIHGIPFQLEQLFTNLIDNSLKYRNPEISPIIKISATYINSSELPAEINPAALHYHRITFEDNGIGFENQYAESIFTLFRRLHGKTEYTGTGIGLAICKRITENHNGLITAEGKVNVGACFHLYFPE